MTSSPVTEALNVHGLEVTIAGIPGRVDLHAYLHTLAQLRLALTELDRRLRPHGGGATRWGVRHVPYDRGLRNLIVAANIPRLRGSDDLALPPRTLVQGVSQLSAQPGLPEAFTPTLIERLQSVGHHVGEGGIESVSLAEVNGHRSNSASFTSEVMVNAGAAVREVTQAFGSVEGVVDLLSARGGRRRASIYDATTRRAVTVYFSDEIAPSVQQLFEQRVVAEGLVARNALGQAVSLRLHHVEALPAPTHLDIESLVGISPNWLGGRMVEEYLEVARRRA